ncbi:MAG: TetR/AcrR family transcriptional regulator [Acidimicrobiia bacterium]|nr:TetR/AcrR family transcriptional regulator [Acidimicrobiia bacterium]
MARYRAGLETRDRILVAVRKLLSSNGLEGTTIKAICAAAGVQAGSFYNLFEGKEQAILAVVREAIDAVDPDPDHHGTDTVEELTAAYVDFITSQPDLARVYVRIGVGAGLGGSDSGDTFVAHHRRRVERFAAAIARSEQGADATAEAEVILAALNGLAVQWLLDATTDFEGLAKLAVGSVAR